ESWSWGESNSGSHHAGGGGGAGKVSAQDFHFVMKLNKASPKLFLACATGKHVPKAVLTCRKAGESQQPYLKLTLTDILVSSYQTGGSAHGDPVPTDQVSLNFAKINVEYGVQDAKGKVNALDQKAGYDLKEQKPI